jgi:large subunit ribosomal protein L9
MKAILIREVKDLGKPGDVVNVSDGYGRNFLIPRKLAIVATGGSLKALELQHTHESNKSAKVLEDAQALGARLQDVTVTIIGKTGQGTRLYGSVTSQDIADALKAQHKIEVDKRKIDVLEPIKSLGFYTVPVRLQRTVTASLNVAVGSDTVPPPPAPEKPKPEPVAAVAQPVVEESPIETTEQSEQPEG